MTGMNAYLEQRQRLIEAGSYDPASERDACGVGLIAAIDGEPRREVVELAIKSLKAVWHRGAVDADGKTGDGAGVRVGVPQDFFKEQVARTGHIPGEGPVAVGMIFLPRTDFAAQERGRTIVETEILRAGFRLYGWRQTPIDPSCLGEKANATRPAIEQILFDDPRGKKAHILDRQLYIVRRRIEKRAREENLPGFYIASLSTRDIIYKGMFLAEAIDRFYPDLTDERFVSSFAIFHQRYSTNTFPEWKLAQPFRMLAHNGEINTLKGNVNWMKSHEILMASKAFADAEDVVKPVIQAGSSDSAALDQVFEVLVRAGRTAPMAKALLIPEAWSKKADIMPARWRGLYEHCNSVMEPWDGPAALAACDGRWAVAGLDRNGLRPLRWLRTHDDLLVVGSETGMTPLPQSRVARRGSIEPGRMVAVDLDAGQFFDANEILDHLAAKHPYDEWLSNIRDIEAEVGPGPEPVLWDEEMRARRQAAAGLTLEDIEIILAPMAEDGKEAIGSMGDDSPLAVLSTRYRPVYHYFRQNFSQVTNPPIDPLREGRVMSLKTRFKNLGNILATDETQTDVFVLDSPILTNGMYQRLRGVLGEGVAEIDCTFALEDAAGSGTGLREALDRIRADAAAAVRDGKAQHLVLTDEALGPERCAVPMALAVGAAHTHLTREGLRTHVSLNVRAADAMDAHACAVLIGLGATTVNPYVAFETVVTRTLRGLGQLTPEKRAFQMKKALDAGLMKILSKMGIAVISSYRGGCNFEVLGLSRAVASEYLGGVTSRISGVGLSGLEQKLAELHRWAWGMEGAVRLPVGGFYRQRSSGEVHAVEAQSVTALQKAVRNEDYSAFRQFVELQQSKPPIQLRDLLDMRALGPAIDISACESVNEIRQRFVTPGMSLGALSPEAHGALNVAMNRIGAKSVSGEGGEDPARYKPLPNGDNMNSAVKQIASGRFGVTAQYLNECREIEIKVAQGAKPGEGGQLPGFKVTKFIAKMRHAIPGTTLISPPPHHDIYSIEDLAQLIYDLKQINPDARVAVKLVSAAGVGAVAAGVAKAHADVILISGNVGGTGASPQTSIKFAGAPLELGLSEAHQVLSLNGLRERVTLRADGGIRTGRDIVIAAMLGAEEFGIGTTSLVALGCLMVRQCHSNTCPVGVCTQDDELRKRFTGLADHVVNLMTFIARDAREILARLGASSIEDVIGRADLLDQVSRGAEHLDDLDLNPLLVRVDPHARPPRSTRTQRNAVAPSLDEQILKDASAVFSRAEKMQLVYDVRNTDRAVGTRVSSAIVRKFGPDGLSDGQLTLHLNGSAGQSLGAFAAKGLRIELEGDANDYVGKGLSGAVIAIRPFGGCTREAPGDAIIGNTVLYGATSGELYAAGGAGQRFAVRNSGATVVVEGCGANGCEYMTGGVAVILGKVGDNFAAGMTGGEAFVLDEGDRLEPRLNAETVFVSDLDADAEARCRSLIEAHVEATGSRHGAAILADWERRKRAIRHVRPFEAGYVESGGVEKVKV
ncbi:glutamate synthase [Glycocaulis albus]|uniref:Glutamate synthase n=1 Tax=Glycocaulis albus TaxID=1382801 RepID=A0ABQ1XCI3_9PROT|nr:glutamate synthase large subunit [Glycocaulis albus]GGG90163.1 glutamate synthase [Glycocaulis albus]